MRDQPSDIQSDLLAAAKNASETSSLLTGKISVEDPITISEPITETSCLGKGLLFAKNGKISVVTMILSDEFYSKTFREFLDCDFFTILVSHHLVEFFIKSSAILPVFFY